MKKTTFALFALVLLLGSGNSLFAQKDLQLTPIINESGIRLLPEGTKFDLRNLADFTDEELRQALSGKAGEKSLTHCFACTGANLTGNCYAIPVGTYANANQQIPAQAGFLSFVTGGSFTMVSTCNDLSSTPPCLAGALDSAVVGNHTGFNSVLLQSVGCVP